MARLLKRILLALAATIVALLAAEIMVRLAGLGPPPQPSMEGKDLRKSADPVLRIENVPGGRRVSTYQDRPGGPERVAVHSINSLGLRGPETTVTKPPGRFRIACLGDSYTYGHGVDDSETWPLLLQSRLAGATNDQGIEVLNFGVRAYETEQEVHQLETRVLDFDPDLVLLCWFFNDNAVGPSAEAVDMEAAPRIVGLIGRPNRGFIQTLRENSQLVDLAVVNLYIPVFYEFMSASRSDLYGDHHPGWRRAKQALRHARDLTRERGLPFGVILYPTLYRDGDVLTSHDAYEQVKAVCADLNVPVLDLEPVFLPHDVPRLHVHAYNSHPNGMANRLTADAVAAWLTERGWLPDAE